MSYDFPSGVDELKKHEVSFHLSPGAWKSFKHAANLSWSSVKFVGAEKSKVPSVRGVYAFCISPDIAQFKEPKFLIYIGETGNSGNHNLHKRFSDYLSEQSKLKRPKLHYYLKKYEGHLHFFFAPIKDKRINLRKLESKLVDSFIPPANTNDFSATLRKSVRALR